ncbi:spore germination protein [Cohnella lupini]|uniref:GerA spore germination protein n=1 Tax=Cohnella lupini TaxID=1294267 RepID=A0A3D9IC63_9BACL|nr:spore germination protein [Cohnella lupini]RED59240.1 GerA spore germination protein [Cohnella lupini]
MVNKEVKDIRQLFALASRSSDFTTNTLAITEPPLKISYYKTLIDGDKLQQYLMSALQIQDVELKLRHLKDIQSYLPNDEIEITDRIEIIQHKLFKGYALIQLREEDPTCALIPLESKKGIRQSNETENEFSVVGPKVGFVEDLETNLHLIRSQLNTPDLIVKELTIGSLSQSTVVILYLDGVANDENVAKIENRISDIDFDVVFDTSQLDQIISDNSLSPFPLFTTTERRDRVIFSLIMGQVAVISEGSPYFIMGPSTLFDFFLSPEDYYLPWILGSFFRIIRILGVIFSIFASALYVAITTFHYEVIPKDLLNRLIFSRQSVPFPPVLEAVFLEITVEFLREAGARLPSRIGQTLGIVGGIILGQAAVEASLSSNILIIIVSLSALASFTTPIYKMSNTIRFLRFPMIILASLWGGLGILIGIGFLLVHITRLQSLGYPYTAPFYPLRVKDLKDSLIRSSYRIINTRAGYLKPDSLIRYKPKAAKRQSDFEEE